MVLKEYIAGWSSLEARRAHNPKVIGSNPIPATYAQIAQLVEQRTENPRVLGSIPSLGTIFMREWLSGRASPCQGEGREFESRFALFYLVQVARLEPF